MRYLSDFAVANIQSFFLLSQTKRNLFFANSTSIETLPKNSGFKKLKASQHPKKMYLRIK
jgi:hypothetical protein